MTPANIALLLALGAGWGFSLTLTKIAVGSGYGHFALVFWQAAIGAATLSLVALIRRKPMPLHPGALKTYLVIAIIGSFLPNMFFYQAAAHLPAGVMSVLLSTVPMWAFPMALALNLERFDPRRLIGLGLGFAAVMMLILPEADLQGALPAFWILVALIPAINYGFEGNYIARWGTAGCDPLEVLWGATLLAALATFPIVLATGQWVAPEWTLESQALIALSIISVIAYAGYVWLVERAGPVFAVQVSYLVTLFGVFWAALFLEERYPSTFWFALVLMLGGMALVQPRLAARPTIAEGEGQ